MGRGVKADWQESSEELKPRYLKEVHPQRRTRLQVLWQLRQGKEVQDVVDSAGASLGSVHHWLQWYRQDSLSLAPPESSARGLSLPSGFPPPGRPLEYGPLRRLRGTRSP